MAGFALDGILNGGIGKHAPDILPSESSIAFRAWFVCELIYGPLSAVIRSSIALLLLRFGPSKTEKWLLCGCLTVVYIFTFIYFFINLLQCSPPSYFWKHYTNPDMSGSCPNPHLLPKTAIAHSVIAAVSDFFIAILSARAIKKKMFDVEAWKEKPTHDNTGLAKMTLLYRGMRAAIGKTMQGMGRNKRKIIIMLFLSLGGA